MALNFGGLAGVTLIAPTADISLQSVPNKTGGDSPLCRTGPRVGQLVNGVENLLGPFLGDNRTVGSSGNIAEQRETVKYHVDEGEPRDCGTVGGNLCGGSLIKGKLAEVN